MRAQVANRAVLAGELLAHVLMSGAHGGRPVTLVGYSMGARSAQHAPPSSVVAAHAPAAHAPADACMLCLTGSKDSHNVRKPLTPKITQATNHHWPAWQVRC